MPEDETNTTPEAPDSADEGSDSSSKQMPEGMRVVRKRRKKRGTGSRETLFLKKREILRDMEEEGAGVVGVKEQVARLKSVRRGEETDKPVEERWGGKKAGHRGTRWLFLRVFALTIPILAIVTAFLLMKQEKARALSKLYDGKINFEPFTESPLPYEPGGSIEWFTENPHEAYSSAKGLLEQLNRGLTGALPPNLFRNEVEVREKIAREGLGWTSAYVMGDPRKLKWSTDKTGETGFLILQGRREDFTKFRAYFVKTPQNLRLDWEATTGWCEAPIDRLSSQAPGRPVLVRCVVAKEPNFDTFQGPGRLISWYLLRSADGDAHAWGFAATGSKLDNELRGVFRFGFIVLERKTEVRVILRLSKRQSGTRPNEFEIEELVAEEWVQP